MKTNKYTMIPLLLSALGAIFMLPSCNEAPPTVKTPPAIPQNLRATARENSVMVTWDAVDGATGYQVTRKFNNVDRTNDVAQNSYEDTDPGNGRNLYTVRAMNADGSSDWSSSVSCTFHLLATPTNVRVTKVGVRLSITWDAVPGATGYAVYRSLERNGTYLLLESTEGAEATQVVDPTPGEGSNYYKVKAFKGEIESLLSEYETIVYDDFRYDNVLTAYDAFVSHLFDTNRKMYRRDTDYGGSLAVNWTQSMFFDMSMNAYKLTGDDKYLTLMHDHLVGCDTYCTWEWYNYHMWDLYDDMMWWVGSLTRAHLLVKDLPADKRTAKLDPVKLLADAEEGFKRVWFGNPDGKAGVYSTNGTSADFYDTYGSYAGDDPDEIVVNIRGGGTRIVRWNDGGMYWDYKFQRYYKPSCINWPTVIAAMYLYKATGNTDYLDKAKDIYEWATNNLFSSNNGRVADGKHGGENGGGGPEWADLIYNQATCIGSGAMLFLETGEQRYLNNAVKAMEYISQSMVTASNVIRGQGAADQSDTGSEHGVYNAILAQYLPILIEDCGQTQFIPLLERTIKMGWKYRDVSRNLMNKNLETPLTTGAASSYTTSGIPALMLIYPDVKERQ